MISVEHPAWAHQFKYLIRELEKKGHVVKVVAINKDRDLELLNAFGIKYDIISNSSGKNTFEKGIIFLITTLRIWQISRKFKPDIYVGRASPMMSINNFLFQKKHIMFEDSENAGFSLALAKLFTDVIITPVCFRKDLGKKHVKIPAYKETFYLHPNQFKPNLNPLNEIGLKPTDKYIILRFVAWQAHHDVGRHGFSLENKRKLVEVLGKYARILITSESPLAPEFEQYRISVSPEKIHDLLYYATLFVGDSQTMTTEAAVLGTPAIRCNTFVGSDDMSNFIELEKKYDLIYSFNNFEQTIQKTEELLQHPDLKERWTKKRQKLLNDKIDTTQFMVNFIENYPESFEKYKQPNMKQ